MPNPEQKNLKRYSSYVMVRRPELCYVNGVMISTYMYSIRIKLREEGIEKKQNYFVGVIVL